MCISSVIYFYKTTFHHFHHFITNFKICIIFNIHRTFSCDINFSLISSNSLPFSQHHVFIFKVVEFPRFHSTFYKFICFITCQSFFLCIFHCLFKSFSFRSFLCCYWINLTFFTIFYKLINSST